MNKKKNGDNETGSYGRRLGEGLNALGKAGRDAVNDPRSIPGQAHGWFRRWFAKVWAVRGGGLYACGFAIAFLYFEITEILFEDIGELLAIENPLTGLLEFIIGFMIDTIMNTVSAFMWPVYVVQWYPPIGAIALGIAFFAFSVYLQEPIEQWLSGDEDSSETTPT